MRAGVDRTHRGCGRLQIMDTITVFLKNQSDPTVGYSKSITFTANNIYDALCRLLILVDDGFIATRIEEETKRVCIFNRKNETHT